jgi:lysophospholipase L1-like esterase
VVARPLLSRLALLAMSVAVALLVCEVTLRIAFGSPPRWLSPQESYVSDPEMNHRLRESQSAFTHDEAVITNSFGLRSPEYPPDPPPGTVRIIGVGDSQTFGNGLAAEETWPAQLERVLARDRPESRWEVLNAGIPSTDTWQHEIWLSRLIDRYRPHAVVLAFYVNDVQRSFEPDPDRDAVTTNTLVKRLGRAARRSAVVSALLRAARSASSMMRPSRGFTAESNLLSGAPDELVEAGWRQVAVSLARMDSRAGESGARLLVCVLPRRDQVWGGTEGDAYNRRVAEIAAGLGVPLVDTLGPLRTAYERHGTDLFISWDGHNSALANQVVAGTIAEAMGRFGILESLETDAGPD